MPPAAAGQQPSDLLSRMLARAVRADFQRAARLPAQRGQAMLARRAPVSSIPKTSVLERLIAIAAEREAPNERKQTGDTGGGAPRASARTAVIPANAKALAAAAPFALPNQTPGVAPKQAASPSPAVDAQAVIEQIVKGVLVSAGRTSQIRLRLSPANLGEVTMKLTVSGNNVSANVIAQSAGVRDALLANQQQLSRSLADAGLSLGGFSVDVSGGNSGFLRQQPQRRCGTAASGAIPALQEDELNQIDPRYGPPLMGGAHSLVLNYLA